MSLQKRRNVLCLVRTKACRRCGGDLSLEYDIYGVYAECIQCGATWSKKDMMAVTNLKSGESPKTARANPAEANATDVAPPKKHP